MTKSQEKRLAAKRARRQNRLAKRLVASSGSPAADRMLLARFDEQLDSILRAPDSPPAVLYHYTHWDAFEPIVRSCTFWATDALFCNDPSELSCADAPAIEAAQRLHREIEGPSRLALRQFIAAHPQERVAVKLQVYVTCFSAARDRLDQWERYGADGEGVCLGLEIIRDEDMPIDDSIGRGLFRVNYSPIAVASQLRDTFSAICRSLNRFVDQNRHLQPQARAIAEPAFFRAAALAATRTKDEDWSLEEEWRQIALVSKGSYLQPLQRSSPKGPIPYLPIRMRAPGNLLRIAEVIVGPKCNPTMTKAVASVLSSAGYPHASAARPAISLSIHRSR